MTVFYSIQKEVVIDSSQVSVQVVFLVLFFFVALLYRRRNAYKVFFFSGLFDKVMNL